MTAGEAVYVVSGTEFDPISSTDNCGIASVENDFNDIASLAGEEFPIGTTTVIWLATDNSSNQSQCSFDVIVSSNIGVQDFERGDIAMYPNPTKDKVYIKLINKNILNISIVDINGKLILKRGSLEANESFDLSNFETGVYIIRIQTDKGMFTSRIIKK